MSNIFFYFLALLGGMALAAQGGINAQLRRVVGSPVMATFISFLVGTFLILIYLILFERNSFPSLTQVRSMPLYKWSGGLIGALFVCSVIVLAPKIGAANMLGLIVAGQMIFAMILDHYGLLGFMQHSINFYRVAGVILLITGVVLIVKN